MPKSSAPFTPKELLFIDEYLVSLNASEAYRKAGYSPKGANVEARKILTKPHIATEIARKLEERHKRLEIDADYLLRRAETILTADLRELVRHHVGACRYCWGAGHEYQWKTPREWREACQEAMMHNRPAPSDVGGYGYKITEKARHDCPECAGLGVPYVWHADTRDLSPAAQVLFEGVRQTKHGMEFRIASKKEAFDLLARHKGLMVEARDKPVESPAKARVVIVPAKVPAEIYKHAIKSSEQGS